MCKLLSFIIRSIFSLEHFVNMYASIKWKTMNENHLSKLLPWSCHAQSNKLLIHTKERINCQGLNATVTLTY